MWASLQTDQESTMTNKNAEHVLTISRRNSDQKNAE